MYICRQTGQNNLHQDFRSHGINRVLHRYQPCPWADIAVALRCLRMGKIDVITYKYVINVPSAVHQQGTYMSLAPSKG
jgi:hypothetical protein